MIPGWVDDHATPEASLMRRASMSARRAIARFAVPNVSVPTTPVPPIPSATSLPKLLRNARNSEALLGVYSTRSAIDRMAVTGKGREMLKQMLIAAVATVLVIRAENSAARTLSFAPMASPAEMASSYVALAAMRRHGGRNWNGGHMRRGWGHVGYWYPRYRYHRYYYGGYPWWGYGGAVYGGYGYADPSTYDGGYGDGGYADTGGDAHVQWCLSRYPSYDQRTDTFLGDDGLRHPCSLPQTEQAPVAGATAEVDTLASHVRILDGTWGTLQSHVRSLAPLHSLQQE